MNIFCLNYKSRYCIKAVPALVFLLLGDGKKFSTALTRGEGKCGMTVCLITTLYRIYDGNITIDKSCMIW